MIGKASSLMQVRLSKPLLTECVMTCHYPQPSPDSIIPLSSPAGRDLALESLLIGSGNLARALHRRTIGVGEPDYRTLKNLRQRRRLGTGRRRLGAGPREPDDQRQPAGLPRH